jgi:CubicO group peptidase (beta-lactamase class C family)
MKSVPDKIRALATAGLGKQAGMVVGILQGGESWVAGCGSLEAAIFEIGSVTKVFTTLLLAEMVGRGEVGLDDPAQKYLPAGVRMPKWGREDITLFHLATHTSSLPRLPGNLLLDALRERFLASQASSLPPGNLWKTIKQQANPYANYEVSDLYAFLSGCKLKRPIGSHVEYSNLGMGLLGHILGLVAGQSYEALVSVRILQPLGMNDTAITLSPEQAERLAPGHNVLGQVTANWDMPTLAGAGALRSTAGDMLRFVSVNMTAANANGAVGPLAEAARLCQRLGAKSRRPAASKYDYALALLFSGLGVAAQWLFGLVPSNPHVVLAVGWPILYATGWLGLAPGLLATFATLAGTYWLQREHHFNPWAVGCLVAMMFLSGLFLRSPRLRNRKLMLGWQYQWLHQIGIGIEARNVWRSLARRILLPFSRGPRFVWHNGATGGYRSFVGFIPEREVAVVVLANSAKPVDAVGVNILKVLDRETSGNR